MAKLTTRRTRRLRTPFLLASAALLVPSSSASFLSSSLDSLRARALLPRAAAAAEGSVLAVDNSTAATGDSRPSVVAASSSQGRYGHSAVYLPPPTNQLLLIGGQLDSNVSASVAPEITSTVLRFNLGSSFLWGDRPASAIPDNPLSNATLSTDGTAWGAAASDASGAVWLFGGLASDCDADAPVGTFANGTWGAAVLEPRTPPRRRQASAVPVANATTGGTDIWVLGGIAEQWTCASDGATVGYLGLDRYDTVGGVVESMAWSAPEGAEAGWAAPVSDYAATALDDGSILVVGGQTAQGELAEMSSVLLFDVAGRSWTQQAVAGDAPSPRMGHVLVPLTSGSFLLHGGLSSTHAPLSDLFLLTPTNSTSYTWTPLVISDSSLVAPSLAWHTATLVAGETIVVAFGIDAATATASSEFYFLTVDEEAGTYTCKDTWDGNGEAVSEAQSTASATSNRLAKKAVEVVVNPKADQVSSSSSAAATTGSYDAPTYYGGSGGAAPAEEASSFSLSSSSSYVVVASATASPKQAASSSSSDSSSDADDDSTTSTKTTAIAASLGAIGGAVALAGLAVLVLRRRAAQHAAQYAVPQSPAMGQSGGPNGGPPVSTLMYTRPVQRRMMSLGSTISPVPSRLDDGSPLVDSGAENLAGVGTLTAGGVGLGTTQDPFSDDYKVNELGQLERAGSSASGTSTAGVVGALKASVQSIPVLSSIARTSESPNPAGGDVYTSPAPTLSHKRSLRRPLGVQALPPLPGSSPVPHTPAELIGLAVTSDDGHAPASAETDGLPYLRADDGKGEGWETLLERNPAPAPSAQAKGMTEQGAVPAILRPGTPLRVANPDPFVDQPQL
ncbi:hypothetical protein JCM10207_001642 [Rhodosporidiobolus poonsookiae]